MAERKAWKISKFDGGLNSHTNPKDLKNNEFQSLVDAQVTGIGVVKPLGQALKSTTISQGFVPSDIISGNGFFSYFSDYSFNPSTENRPTITTRVTEQGTYGWAPHMQFRLSNFVWLFPDKPVCGKLMMRVGFYDPDDATPWDNILWIHGTDAGADSPLVVLDDISDWEGLSGGNVAGGGAGTSVNLFNSGWHFSYVYNGIHGTPPSADDDASQAANPDSDDVTLYPSDFNWSWPFIDPFNPEANNTHVPNRVSGRWAERNSDSELSDGSWGLEGEFIDLNGPNSWDIYHTYYGGWEFGVAPFFWPNITNYNVASSDNNNITTNIGWYGFNDARNIFTSKLPGYAAHWAVGMSSSNGYSDDDPWNVLWDTVAHEGSTPGVSVGANEHIRFPSIDYRASTIFANAEWDADLPESLRKDICWNQWSSLAHHLIRAINTWKDGDVATNALSRFIAKFENFDYRINPLNYDIIEELPNSPSFNQHYFYSDSKYDSIMLTASARTAFLNGYRMHVELTSSDCKNSDGDTVTQYKVAGQSDGSEWVSLFQAASSDNPFVYGLAPDRGTIVEGFDANAVVIKVHKWTMKYLTPGEIIKVVSGGTIEYMKIITHMPTEYTDVITRVDGASHLTNMLHYVQVERAQHGMFARNTGKKTAQNFSSATGANSPKIYKMLPMPLNNDEFGNSVRTMVIPNDGKELFGTGVYNDKESHIWGGYGGDNVHTVVVRFAGNIGCGDTLRINSIGFNGAQQSDEYQEYEATLDYDMDSIIDAYASLASDFITHVENNWGGIDAAFLSQEQTSGYTEVKLTSQLQGADGIFVIHTSIELAEANTGEVTEIVHGETDEFSLLMSKSTYGANELDDFVDSPNNEEGIVYYETRLNVHSKISGSWISYFDRIDSPTQLKWWYSTNQANDPLFWNEGSDLRIVERNFNLHNPSKILKWYDTREWFRDADLNFMEAAVTEAGWQALGFQLLDNNKTWNFTGTDKIEDGLGINQGDGLISQSEMSTGLYASYDNPHTLNGSETADWPYAGMAIQFTKQDTGGEDWNGTCNFYASVIYDDDSESLPLHRFVFATELDFTPGVEEEMDNMLRMTVSYRPFNYISDTYCFGNSRIKGIHLYYTNSEEGHDTFWSLGKLTNKDGFLPSASLTTSDQVLDSGSYKVGAEWEQLSDTSLYNNGPYQHQYLVLQDNRTATETLYYDMPSMPKLDTFESVNGFSPFNRTLECRYKAQCISGRRSFVGNIAVKESNSSVYTYYNDRMIVSPMNSLDTYPYPDNILDLDISDGDEIVELFALGDKVMQFKKNMLYIINVGSGIPAEYFVEKRLKYKGISNKNHMVETAMGVFWVNKFGAFMYDGGDEVLDLSLVKSDDNKKRRIYKKDWQDFLSDNSLVGYNPASEECFVVKSHTHSERFDGDCYVYNVVLNCWAYGNGRFYVGKDKKITNFIQVGDNKKLGYMYTSHYNTDPIDDGTEEL